MCSSSVAVWPGSGRPATSRARSPWASYAIIEARHTIGGTWDLFRYPGVRSDSDMFTLGYSFRPWEGDTSIVDGESILQYIKDTAVEAPGRSARSVPPSGHQGGLVQHRVPLARHGATTRHR